MENPHRNLTFRYGLVVACATLLSFLALPAEENCYTLIKKVEGIYYIDCPVYTCVARPSGDLMCDVYTSWDGLDWFHHCECEGTFHHAGCNAVLEDLNHDPDDGGWNFRCDFQDDCDPGLDCLPVAVGTSFVKACECKP